MSIQRLPSGRYRAQVYASGRNVSVSKVLGGPGTFDTKRDARAARERARLILGQERSPVTVAGFRDRWLTDPLFVGSKRESTLAHLTERTRPFATAYADTLMVDVNDLTVAEWLRGGKRNGHVPALRAMFGAAASARAGRIVARNPFAELGLEKGKGNALKLPPAEETMWAMLEHARNLTTPAFADWLEFACFTGARPGEIDALRLSAVDMVEGEIRIGVQWNPKVRKFTPPKYGPYTLALVDHVRHLVAGMKRDQVDDPDPFVFLTLRGHHFTPSSRTHHWNKVRAATGIHQTSLYLATRHYFGWYAKNVLELPNDVIALQLGHKDGGRLVATLYGHLEGKNARRRIRAAFEGAGQVRPLKVVRKDVG